jgi:hypothetical protein
MHNCSTSSICNGDTHEQGLLVVDTRSDACIDETDPLMGDAAVDILLPGRGDSIRDMPRTRDEPVAGIVLPFREGIGFLDVARREPLPLLYVFCVMEVFAAVRPWPCFPIEAD